MGMTAVLPAYMTMIFKTILTLSAAASAAFALSSCTTEVGPSALSVYQAYDRPATLPANPDKVRVKVSLSRQRAYVMEDGKMLLVMPVSVGAPESRTPSGNFRIFSKVHTKRDQSHGYAFRGAQVKKTLVDKKPAGWSFKGTPLPYWCEFEKNHAFHTGWVRHHPCTNGCIRMHENVAPKFYRLVKTGTPVNIAYSQPEDSSHGKIPLPPDAGPLPDYPTDMYLGNGYFTRHMTPAYE